MKKIWSDKIGKIGIISLAAAFLVMFLGLILIGASKVHVTDKIKDTVISESDISGFDFLKQQGVGSTLGKKDESVTVLGQKYDETYKGLVPLKVGAVMAAILTPIAFAGSFATLGYYFYKTKK